VVRAWDLGSGPVASWAKLLNILALVENGTDKPSTLMRRHEILLLLLSIRLLPGLQREEGTCVRLGVLGGACQIALYPGL
jgi:hypothetical protein